MNAEEFIKLATKIVGEGTVEEYRKRQHPLQELHRCRPAGAWIS